jgi:peptide/nickel transport system permease protein
MSHKKPNTYFLGVGIGIIYLSQASFLGIGVQPPTPELGSMAANVRPYLFVVSVALWLAPGLVLSAVIFAWVLSAEFVLGWLGVSQREMLLEISR